MNTCKNPHNFTFLKKWCTYDYPYQEWFKDKQWYSEYTELVENFKKSAGCEEVIYEHIKSGISWNATSCVVKGVTPDNPKMAHQIYGISAKQFKIICNALDLGCTYLEIISKIYNKDWIWVVGIDK
jgi:hypothetical protein